MCGYPAGHFLYSAGLWYVNKSINQVNTMECHQERLQRKKPGAGVGWGGGAVSFGFKLFLLWGGGGKRGSTGK